MLKIVLILDGYNGPDAAFGHRVRSEADIPKLMRRLDSVFATYNQQIVGWAWAS